MFKWLKQLFTKAKVSETQEQVPATEVPAPVVLPPEPQQQTVSPIQNPDESTSQLLKLLDSTDITNHQLAAMLMQGIPFEWTTERLEQISQYASIFSFWLQEEGFAPQIERFEQLSIGPKFFKNYEDIATFAQAIPRLQNLQAFYWKAGPYWNQHPIVKALFLLPKLEVLSLCNCRMHHLPIEIQSAQKLKALYLSGNKIEQLPEVLDQLQQITILHLDNNNFKYFPAVISRLKNLENLKIQLNPIEEILPSDIGPLYQLKTLHLPENIARRHLDAYKERLTGVDFTQPQWLYE